MKEKKQTGKDVLQHTPLETSTLKSKQDTTTPIRMAN